VKHKFTITYETDGLPICPDAIHKQLDQAMVNIRQKFEKQYYMLPGLHKLWLEPCGDWFPEEQKPMRFKPQATSAKRQATSTIKGTHSNGRILKIERKI
jgi:hypothetical protein